MEHERRWRGREPGTGIASELGTGATARGLPDRAAASYGVVEMC